MAGLLQSLPLEENTITDDGSGCALSVARTMATQQIRGSLNERVIKKHRNQQEHLSFYSWATQCGHSSLVKVLLNECPLSDYDVQSISDQHMEDDWDGMTLLGLAAFCGQEPVARVLVANRVNLEATDSHGKVALHIAASKGHEQIVKLLLENGAEVGAIHSETKWTSLHMAAIFDHEQIVKLLLSYGAEFGAIEARLKQTPLHITARKGHDRIVQILTDGGDGGAKVDARTNLARLQFMAPLISVMKQQCQSSYTVAQTP